MNDCRPEYKRLAAFTGDFVFTGPRRFLLEHASVTQDAWSYCTLYSSPRYQFRPECSPVNKAGKNASALGAYHASDAPFWFNTTSETIGADALSEWAPIIGMKLN